MLCWKANKPETVLYRAPTFPILVSHDGTLHESSLKTVDEQITQTVRYLALKCSLLLNKCGVKFHHQPC